MARPGLMRYLPFSSTTTPLQAATYLLGISLFSISFLVFLNSSISFVVTDLIGQRHGVGDVVGTLGFVDELVALVACPAWGLASDRLGVRNVAVIGYTVIGLALVLFVQARNVYPQLLLARLLFALGASAATTMVTAILPSLTDESSATAGTEAERLMAGDRQPTHNPRGSIAFSVDSQQTITPERFRSSPGGGAQYKPEEGDVDGAGSGRREKSSVLAGWVGLFTGCGALVALAVFLPLPARFGNIEGVTLGQAVSYSFYVVGAIAFVVAIFVGFGLRNIHGEQGKGWCNLLDLNSGSLGSNTQAEDDDHLISFDRIAVASGNADQRVLPYWRLLRDSVLLGFSDSQIGLGYLAGFVARASTVAISLFIPLFVNAFFIRNGFCQGSPTDPSPDLKKECREAYVLASILTGVAQFIGLISAPLFGYLSGSRARRRSRVSISLVVSSLFGIVGYIAFPQLPSPEIGDKGGRGGSPLVFLLVALMGVSQIGAIVCSLGSLGRGILAAEPAPLTADTSASQVDGAATTDEPEEPPLADEASNLLGPNGRTTVRGPAPSRVQLKGSIAGVYSWCGGAAILLLTKLGGYLFDIWSTGAPFYMMAVFNGVLLVASLGVDISRWVHDTHHRRQQSAATRLDS